MIILEGAVAGVGGCKGGIAGGGPNTAEGREGGNRSLMDRETGGAD